MNASYENELEVQKRNFRHVQIDAIGVSISNVAAPFLPVFLTRLGATNFQVGLLSSMPGMTGLVLAILVGRFLQTRRNVVPWYGLGHTMEQRYAAFEGNAQPESPGQVPSCQAWRKADQLENWSHLVV